MPVSFIPLLLPMMFVSLLIYSSTRGFRCFLKMAGVIAALMVIVILPFFIPGWLLMWRASRGDAAAMYELGWWYEMHNGKVGEIMLWPFSGDSDAAYAELERAAAAGYIPAIYTLGVHLKYGKFVPEPPDWTGPAGNVFPQPELGQPLIDRALKAGYRPTMPEDKFYWETGKK